MSVIAQIAVVIMIIIIGVIIFYANKGLETAEQEGERFLDEWELKQQMKERKNKKPEVTEQQTLPEENYDPEYYGEEVPEEEERKIQTDNVIPMRAVCAHRYILTVCDEHKNKIGIAEVDHYPFKIGRDSKNDLVLNDLGVAYFHCEIIEKNGDAILRDKGTMNRIYADGHKNDQLLLQDKTRFYLGNYEIMVQEVQHRSAPTQLASRSERNVL